MSQGNSAGLAVVFPSAFFEILKTLSMRGGGGRAAERAREQSTVRSDPLDEDPTEKGAHYNKDNCMVTGLSDQLTDKNK